EVSDDAPGVPAGSRPVDPGSAGIGALGLMAEHAVFPDRRLEQQPLTLPILGYVPDASDASIARVPAGDLLARQQDPARLDRSHAHDCLDELGLAVAFDARQPNDLTAPNDKTDVVHDGSAVERADGEPFDGKLH